MKKWKYKNGHKKIYKYKCRKIQMWKMWKSMERKQVSIQKNYKVTSNRNVNKKNNKWNKNISI